MHFSEPQWCASHALQCWQSDVRHEPSCARLDCSISIRLGPAQPPESARRPGQSTLKLHSCLRLLRCLDRRTSHLSSLPPLLSFPDYRLFLPFMTFVFPLSCRARRPSLRFLSPDRHPAPRSDPHSQSSLTAPAPEYCCADILNSAPVSVATPPEMPPPENPPTPDPQFPPPLLDSPNSPLRRMPQNIRLRNINILVTSN
jgi:hypothetical protein